MKNHGLSLNPKERREQAYGATLTFENAAGELLTIVRRHVSTYEAVRQACDLALEQDDTYRVVSLSTPHTIYADLIGNRRLGQFPEQQTLATAGRKQMLHPRLWGSSSFVRGGYRGRRKS